MSSTKKVAIVGGGISGLSAAYYLSQQFKHGQTGLRLDIDLFEASDRLGGVIDTRNRDGCLMEGGPDSLFTAKDDAINLIRELGIEANIIETNKEKRRSLLASEGELVPLPDGFVMLAPSDLFSFARSDLLTPMGKLRTCLDLILPPKRFGEEESVADFVRRRFGSQLLERVVQPMVGGIYVGDVEKLSAQSTIPQFVEMERTAGSVISGLVLRRTQTKDSVSGARYGMFVSLKDGIGCLVDELIRQTGSCSYKKGKQVISLERENGLWTLLLEDQRASGFDAVILATPSSQLSSLVASLDNCLAQELSSIPCASSCVVNLLYRTEQTDYDFDSFGFVVPASEKRSIIAGSFSSVKYPGRCPENMIMIRAFLGGVLNEGILAIDDDQIISSAYRDIADYLVIKGDPVASWLARWDKSMPQYLVGHKARVKRIFSRVGEFPGLSLCGNSFNGVGIPDCIASARLSALAISEYLT